MAPARGFLPAALTAIVGAVALCWQAPSSAQDRAPEAAPPGLVISEILFDPKPDDAPFVELLNAGSQPVDVSQMALILGDDGLPLTRVTDPLPPGALLLIQFDGGARVEGRTVHAPMGVTLPQSGTAELRDGHNDPIDRVAWGAGDGAAAIAGANAGGTIGRPPGSNRPFDLGDWATYRPSGITPGERNGMPGVEVLVPFDGDRLPTPFVLEWDPVVGATGYRVQVARDEQFASTVLDTTASTTDTRVASMDPGQYFWRVQSLGPDRAASPFSTANSLDVIASGQQVSARAQNFFADWHLGPAAFLQAPARPAPTKRLGVVAITQHKDTTMLQLEQVRRHGPHAWDDDHRDYDRDDPSDATNCVLAAVAMANRFLHGNLSQDRIAYEVRSRNADKYVGWIAGMQSPADAGLFANYTAQLKEKQAGPEWDFAYGDGLYDAQTVAALTFAFNGGPGRTAWMESYLDASGIWEHIKPEIDAGRPVVGARLNPSGKTAHAFIATGYGFEPDGKRFLTAIDPTGRPDLYIHIDAFRNGSMAGDFSWFFIPKGGTARQQEPEVFMDSDGDGVVDFDETERFFTDPHKMDTDGDGVPDKADIASGVFDTVYGYAAHTASPKGRDFDADGLPTERDPDSDNGGCNDGAEDIDRSGDRNGDERWNFDTADDLCADIDGKIEVHKAFFQTNGLHLRKEEDMVVTVKLQPAEAGLLGSIVDRASTYTMRAFGTQRLDNGDCPLFTRFGAEGGGDFSREGSSIGGTIFHDDPSGRPGDSGYDPGGFRLNISAGAAADGRSHVDSCAFAGSSPYQGDVSTFECIGKPPQPDSRTFVFNCTTLPPAPPDTVITLWTMKGVVTVLPPRVGALPLGNLFRHAQ
jgi:hypothetical protein